MSFVLLQTLYHQSMSSLGYGHSLQQSKKHITLHEERIYSFIFTL